MLKFINDLEPKDLAVSIREQHVMKGIVEQILEAYELNNNNTEVYWEDDYLFVYPSHKEGTSIQIEIHQDKMNGMHAIGLASFLLSEISWNLLEFSADDEFDELYSPEFGKRNDFTPSGFIKTLTKVEEDFKDIASRMMAYKCKMQYDFAHRFPPEF